MQKTLCRLRLLHSFDITAPSVFIQTHGAARGPVSVLIGQALSFGILAGYRQDDPGVSTARRATKGQVNLALSAIQDDGKGGLGWFGFGSGFTDCIGSAGFIPQHGFHPLHIELTARHSRFHGGQSCGRGRIDRCKFAVVFLGNGRGMKRIVGMELDLGRILKHLRALIAETSTPAISPLRSARR